MSRRMWLTAAAVALVITFTFPVSLYAAIPYAGLRLSLATDQPYYRAGAIARITLTLVNHGAYAIPYVSNAEGHPDVNVVATGPDGQQHWLDRAVGGNRFALPVMTRRTLGAGERVNVQLTWPVQGLTPGVYTLTATLPVGDPTTEVLPLRHRLTVAVLSTGGR